MFTKRPSSVTFPMLPGPSLSFPGTASKALAIAMALGAGCSGSGSKDSGVPKPIVDGNTQVSATIDCGKDKDCGSATVYVSACNARDPSDCYKIKPSGTKGGNTYIVALSEDDLEMSSAGLKIAALDEAPGDPSATDSEPDAGAGGGLVEAPPPGQLVEGARCEAPQQGKKALPVDLLFVIDTTSSMGSAITGVVESINAFVNKLAKQNVDARIGGIAFGDAAPLPLCTEPNQPFAGFTKKYGAGTAKDAESFNFWLSGLTSSYCGDGGGDGPENALDAIEFALGNDPKPGDAFKANAFDWNPGSLRVMIVITDVSQHQKSDGLDIAHFDLDDVTGDLAGLVVAHVVATDFSCSATPFAFCACDKTDYACDEGCSCDAQCPIAGCAADKVVGTCDNPEKTCDIDCPGYKDSACDKTINYCDYAAGSTTEPCKSDYDCRNGATAGSYSAQQRRCSPQNQEPYADPAQLAYTTHGAFTPLPYDGRVDLTKLPLTGILLETSRCEVQLPRNTGAVRVVYSDDSGNAGEVTVPLQP